MIPDVALGAIIAALIAAVISLLSLIITKEMKISEFRQAWINDLRNDIAEAISAVATINLLFSSDHQTNLTSQFVEAWTRTSAALARIELRLNVSEEAHRGLQGLIRETEELIHKGEDGAFDQRNAENLQDRVVKQAQVILKLEWDRVREGEPTFKKAKTFSGVILLAILMALGFRYLADHPCPGNSNKVQESSQTHAS